MGGCENTRARFVCTSLLLRYRTSSKASRGCAENRETARAAPPNVPTLPALPRGNRAMSNLFRIGDSAAWLSRYAVGQPRMNAASPATQTFSAFHSSYPTTLGGEMDPTQRAALCHARIAFGLFTLMVPSSSIIFPPPSAACHSSALQVNASAAAPCHTKPQNFFLPLARSPT